MPDEPEGVPGSDYGAGHEDFVMFGDIRVTGKLKSNGLPTRGDFGRFAQSRMTDLNEQLRRGEGIFSKDSVFAFYLPSDASQDGDLVFGGINKNRYTGYLVDVPLTSETQSDVSLDAMT